LQRRPQTRSTLAHLVLASLLTLATACSVTHPTLKIGLVAPFEGRYRAIGYEVIYAARLAVREANAAGGVGGHWIELVSLDDGGDVQLAEQQVAKLAVDAEVMAVIGHWLPTTTQASLDGYAQTGLAVVATGQQPAHDAGVALLSGTDCLLWGPVDACVREWPRSPDAGQIVCAQVPLPATSADPDFVARFQTVSQGVAPGPQAVLAYDAVHLVLAAIGQAADGQAPTRATVTAALRTSPVTGLAGEYAFAPDGSRTAAPVWAYAFDGSAWQTQADSSPCSP
jgi:ABC-type branched-subunit amino acid transport system substrate-binding protein